MSRKNILAPELIASQQSLAASFQTVPTVINYADNIAYQINVTTSNSTGTFSVQVSVDYQQATPSQAGRTGNWADLSLGGGVPTVTAANDSIAINLFQLPFSAVRLSYVAGAAGTGHADIYIMHKQVGG